MKPGKLTIQAISVAAGTALTALVIWLFGIDISGPDRYAVFPDEWTVFEFVRNAFAAVLWVGSIRAVAKGLGEYYSGKQGPPQGTPGTDDES